MEASEVGEHGAEKDALARLEAWHKAHLSHHYIIRPGMVHLMGWTSGSGVAAFTSSTHHLLHGPSSDFSGLGRVPRDTECVTVGTDDKPATLSDCILAALELFARLYPEKEGATT